MTSRPIVVGYDGSAGGRDALAFAAEAATLNGAPVHLLHAWLPRQQPAAYTFGAPGGQPGSPEAAGRAVLADGLDRLKGAWPGLEATSILVRGTATEALLERAAGAQMLVVGSRGLGGFAGLLLGSTSLHVAGHAACPVVIVRPSAPDEAPGPEAGRVVVGLDASPAATTALGFAFEQAAARHIGLTAVLSLATQGTQSDTGLSVLDLLAMDAETGTAMLNTTLTDWRQKYPDVDVRTRVEPRHPVHALVEASAGALLLVVGSRGLSGLRSLVLGSVSHGVLHHARVPVAVVRQQR